MENTEYYLSICGGQLDRHAMMVLRCHMAQQYGSSLQLACRGFSFLRVSADMYRCIPDMGVRFQNIELL